MNRPTFRQTFQALFVCLYAVAVVFFALIRITGIMWFQAEYVDDQLPVWATYVIITVSYVAEGAIILKTLAPVTWGVAIFFGFFSKLLDAIFPHQGIRFVLQAAYILFLPLFFNKDREQSVGESIIYFLGIFIYQALMMLGRGYPLMAKFNAAWQLVGIIDYKMFLISIMLLREVYFMWGDPGSGCFLLFGPFEKAAKAIGRFLLRPFTRKGA